MPWQQGWYTIVPRVMQSRTGTIKLLTGQAGRSPPGPTIYWLCNKGGTPWGRFGGALPVESKYRHFNKPLEKASALRQDSSQALATVLPQLVKSRTTQKNFVLVDENAQNNLKSLTMPQGKESSGYLRLKTVPSGNSLILSFTLSKRTTKITETSPFLRPLLKAKFRHYSLSKRRNSLMFCSVKHILP